MAVRDDDKVMAGLLRRTLASSTKSGGAPAANHCPPADILAAYYEHSLDADESTRYELHFSQCALCRDQLAAMARVEEMPQTQPKTRCAWIWNPYWLAPALAVLALAIFFGVRHSVRITATAVTSQPANAPLVAMSRPDQALPQESAAPAPRPPAAARNAPSNELQQAELDSIQRDSLAKEKQSPSRESPALQTAPLAYSAPSPLPATPAPSDKKAQDALLDGQTVSQLQALRKSETTQKDTGAPQSSTQTVSAAAAALPVEAAPNPAPSRLESAPAPSALGGVAGAGTATASGDKVAAESASRNQAKAPASISGFAGIARPPTSQTAAEISTHRVFQTPNTNVLWRSADGGFVERSPDGGATWQGQQLPGISGEIAAGSSPTAKICWLVGSAGTIFMTKDATNWTKIAAPANADFTSVTARDASRAAVTAADGRVFQTTDGGKHWKVVP